MDYSIDKSNAIIVLWLKTACSSQDTPSLLYITCMQQYLNTFPQSNEG